MQFPAMFKLIRFTFKGREKLNCGPMGKAKSGPMGKAKGTNQTTVRQACTMITCKFRDFV